MNERRITVELASLVAWTIAVYAGAALLVAAFGNGRAVSLGAAATVAVLSYTLARGLRQMDISARTAQVGCLGLSVLLLCLIMHVEITGNLFVWQMGWVRETLTGRENVFAEHRGYVVELVVLSAAWLFGVARGVQPLSLDRLLTESSAGLILVFLAGAFVSAADQAGAVRWLAAPYMCAALFSLARAHAPQLNSDEQRSFRVDWAAWTGVPLIAIAAAGMLTNVFAPDSLGELGGALVVVLQALGLAIVIILSPVILAASLAAGLIANVLPDNKPPVPPIPQVQGADPQAQHGQTALWAQILGYGLLIFLGTMLAIVALIAIQRVVRQFAAQPEEDDEVGEEFAASTSSLRTLLGATIGRLGRIGPRPGDAIGRLYVKMLRAAARQGVVRPPAWTPLEFAGRLQAHFNSATPVEISAAYARARYAARPPTKTEVDRLRNQWRKLVHGP